MAEVWHLWRDYPVPPFSRYAASIEVEGEGFRVVEHDPRVADTLFHTLLHRTATMAHTTIGGDGEGYADELVTRHPGEDGHLETAIGALSGIHRRPLGRPA